jgi:cytokinin riboside 5'-monophosphate phosphoribohydrolase
MHERKSLMVELADAFIALPGGFGTFDELFETITWAQLGIHQKPIGVLNVAGYFDPLLALVDRAVQEGFVQKKYRRLFVVANQVEELLDALRQHEPLDGLIKWLDLSET